MLIYLVTAPKGLMVANCLNTCKARDFAYCELEYGQECWSQDTMPFADKALTGDESLTGLIFVEEQYFQGMWWK